MKFRTFLPKRFYTNVPVIPIVKLSGVISAGSGNLLRPSLSLAGIAPLLAKAFAIKRAPAVAIMINSPGGSPVQSRLIHSRIRELAREKKKKVLIFVEDVAASGGYLIALAGDEIIADETSIIGSIGVISATFGFDKAIEKLGIERRIYSAGKNKMSLDPFQPEKTSDISHLKSLQKEVHETFIAMVQKMREGKLSTDKDIFTGLYWTGQKAKELGLIDGLGHMSSILKHRFGDDVKLRLIEPKRGLFSRSGILSSGSSSLATNLAEGIGDVMYERLLWARYGL